MDNRDVWPVAAPQSSEEPAVRAPLRHLIPPLLIGSGIGLIIYVFFHRPMAYIVWTISISLFVCGLLLPRVFLKIEGGLRVFAHWVGLGLTVLLLVPFYWLVFAPGRLLFKLSGKDPMTRACPTDLPSYWQERTPIDDHARHLERQF